MNENQYRLADEGRFPGTVADFDRGIGFAEMPPAPCRSIAITPAVIALDEAQRRAREKPMAWQRPAAAKPIVEKESPIVKVPLMPNKVQKPHGGQANMRFSNCGECGVRLSVAEMLKHTPVCKRLRGK